jgi:CRP/FNR family transcriptional regulator, anaerobic regulatory protein
VLSPDIKAPSDAGCSIASCGSKDLSTRELLRDVLVLGRRRLRASFQCSPPCTLGPGELLATAAGSRDAIYLIRAGWACQFRNLANGRRAIVDVYLPGDVIGLDAVLRTRCLEEVLTLTSVTSEAIHEEDALIDLMASQPTALYIVWLLGQRQQRADRLLSAVQCLDARGRLATMVLDFCTRLRRRRLITGSTYNLPLTQRQIGSYLGLTVVHVNRILRSLRDERIAQIEKNCMAILDLERLKRLAQQGWPENSVAQINERSSSEIAFSNRQAADKTNAAYNIC